MISPRAKVSTYPFLLRAPDLRMSVPGARATAGRRGPAGRVAVPARDCQMGTAVSRESKMADGPRAVVSSSWPTGRILCTRQLVSRPSDVGSFAPFLLPPPAASSTVFAPPPESVVQLRISKYYLFKYLYLSALFSTVRPQYRFQIMFFQIKSHL